VQSPEFKTNTAVKKEREKVQQGGGLEENRLGLSPEKSSREIGMA
jgi:hypothetical protein